MAKHVVAAVADIPPGTRRLTQVNGRAIVVFNLGGEFFALNNRCPHRGGSLFHGKQTGLVESDGPGNYRYSRPGEIIRCPWHGWEFDVRTGQSWCDPARVSRTPVRGLGAAGNAAHPRPLCRRDRAGHGRGRLRGGRGLTPFRQPLACPPSSLRPDVKARQMKKAERIIATSPGDR